MKSLEDLRLAIAEFADERDWDQFHSPKNLAMALSVEVAELVEHFQWLSAEQADDLDPETLHAVGEEIADVQYYLVRLADRLGIDILAAADGKLAKNRAKYPVAQAKGSALKYTRLNHAKPPKA